MCRSDSPGNIYVDHADHELTESVFLCLLSDGTNGVFLFLYVGPMDVGNSSQQGNGNSYYRELCSIKTSLTDNKSFAEIF